VASLRGMTGRGSPIERDVRLGAQVVEVLAAGNRSWFGGDAGEQQVAQVLAVLVDTPQRRSGGVGTGPRRPVGDLACGPSFARPDEGGRRARVWSEGRTHRLTRPLS
jgi:hypothetical protein